LPWVIKFTTNSHPQLHIHVYVDNIEMMCRAQVKTSLVQGQAPK